MNHRAGEPHRGELVQLQCVKGLYTWLLPLYLQEMNALAVLVSIRGPQKSHYLAVPFSDKAVLWNQDPWTRKGQRRKPGTDPT